MSQKFDSFANKVKLNSKVHFNKFLDKNNQESVGLAKIEKFCAKYFVFIANNWDDYYEGNALKTRTRICLTLRLILLLISIKFLFSTLFPKHQGIRAVLSDGTYLLGDSRLISSFCFIGSFLAVSTGLLYNYYELKGRLFVVQFLNDIKYKRNTFRLSNRNSNKFGIHLNLISKYAMEQVSTLLGGSSVAFLITTSILAYIPHESDFNLPSLILWTPITAVTVMQLWKILLGGIVIWYAFLVYLKYQFREINELIEISVKNKNTNSLLNAILRHKSVEQTVHELNKMYNKMVFILYLASVPAIDIAVYMLHRGDTSIIMKLISLGVGVTAINSVFALNYTCAQIIKTAHKSRPLLYSFLIETKLSIHQKLKIQHFLEHLSGADIGFYCLDLFPMNSARFSEFIIQVFIRYFLLIKLL